MKKLKPRRSVDVHPEYVLLLLDGPSCSEEVYRACGDSAIAVDFRMMPGFYCPNFDRVPARIEPLLPSPISMSVSIMAATDEYENPCGLAIIAQVQDVMRYCRYLTKGHPFCEAVVRRNQVVRLSYDCHKRTGGIALYLDPPYINSRSDIMRIYDHGRSFYEIVGNRERLPASSAIHYARFRPQFD